MAFHNFSALIRSHDRPFTLLIKQAGSRSANTSRFQAGIYSSGTKCRGAFETITEKDLQKYPDFELTSSDMKITTTPELLSGVEPNIKDKVIYNGVTYWVKRVINKVHYGNFYIIFLTFEAFQV